MGGGKCQKRSEAKTIFMNVKRDEGQIIGVKEEDVEEREKWRRRIQTYECAWREAQTNLGNN